MDNSNEDYSKISKYIKSYPTWAKIFARTWFIASNDNPSDIRDGLSKAVNGKGEIIVIKISNSSWASYKIDKKLQLGLRKTYDILMLAKFLAIGEGFCYLKYLSLSATSLSQ